MIDTRPVEAIRTTHCNGKGQGLEVGRIGTILSKASPIMVEGTYAVATPEGSERMDIAFAKLAPIVELDAELKGRAGCGHEFSLVDPEPFVEGTNVRQGRLADPDDADRFGLYQMHRAASGKQFAERCRSHPPGGAAAQYGNAHFAWIVQNLIPTAADVA